VTAIPADHGVTPFVLICDTCGRTHDNHDRIAATWDLLWQQATTAGWNGLPRPLGPHACPHCDG
jgi:hypothetical protein